jgi:hypothetical protein
VRYWQDQVRLAVKAAIAAVGAWALARYAVGQSGPYFAPLAALRHSARRQEPSRCHMGAALPE